jgi:arylsulfatase
MHEGGISTPFIVRWPGQVRGGTMARDVGHIIDLLPTCAEIAGLKAPMQRNGKTLLPVEGQSLLPVWQGRPAAPHGPLFWEWSGNRAMRDGPWKLVRDNTVGGWELYDIERDRTEMHDLAQLHPERVERMSGQWRAWAVSTGVDPDKSMPIRLKRR